MNLRQEATRGIVWSAASIWGGRAITFVVTLILARLVLPEAFGLVAFASVFIAFAQIFQDQGFSDALVQRSQLDLEHLDTAFWFNVLAGGLLALLGSVASGLVARLFHEPQLAPIVGWLSLSFLFNALSRVQEAILRRQLAFRRLAVCSIAAGVFSGVVAVIVALLGFGVWSLVVKMLMNGLASAVVLWRVSDWRPRFNVSTRHFRELFAFGISISGSSIVDFFSRRSADFLIGLFLGPVALGYYTIAYNLVSAMTDLLIAVPNAVVFPAFSRLQKEPARLLGSFYEVSQLSSAIAFPTFLGVSLLAPEVILVVYGQSWAPSIPVTRILMLIGIVHSAFYFYGNVLKAVGKPSWRFGVLSLIAVLNVAGIAVAVRWGIDAVAAAFVSVGFLVFPVYFYVIRKLIPVSPVAYARLHVPVFICSSVMTAVVLGLRYILRDSLGLHLRLMTLSLVGAVSYLLTLRLIHLSLYRQILGYVRQALSGLFPGRVQVTGMGTSGGSLD